MKVDGGGGLEMFLDSFTQRSARFSYVGTGAVYLRAFVVVDDACLIAFGILVLEVA